VGSEAAPDRGHITSCKLIEQRLLAFRMEKVKAFKPGH
jgi:hypothetical protein